MRDLWAEIFHTIRNNLLRTFLTGLAVAWGIMILVILLGAGNGLENGVKREFASEASNALTIRPGQTSVPYDGLQAGRYVKFTNEDYEDLATTLSTIDAISAQFFIWQSNQISYGQENGTFNIKAIHPSYLNIEFEKITAGRFINEFDIRDSRRVCVIDNKVQEALFKTKQPLGELIHINGSAMKVVGITEAQLNDRSNGHIYLPIYTAQQLVSGSNKIDRVMLTTDFHTAAENSAVADHIRQKMARKHRFSTEDRRALYIHNRLEQYEKFNQLFGGINFFVWFIGFGTIIAGIVGVSNIMMIVVKERTREIGIRKAIGATPISITSMIVIESVLITAFSGYMGMLVGVLVLEWGTLMLPPTTPFFTNPQIDLNTAIQANVVLVVAGTFAGLVPALKAARIRPIEALREE